MSCRCPVVGAENSFYDEVLQNFLHALDDYDRALTLNHKNEEAARMKAQATAYYLQQREKLGDDANLSELAFYDERFGYTAYKKQKETSLLERTNHVIAFSKTKEQWLQEGINHYLAEDYTNSLRACELAILQMQITLELTMGKVLRFAG